MSGVLLRDRGFKGGDGSTSRLRFRLLGPLQTHRGTKAPELGPPKQRALLAVLLLRPGLETDVDQLIEALWGEGYPAYAKNLIQKSVSGLRDLLSADEGGGRGVFLKWSSGGYRMDTGDSEVDLYEYERLAAAGIAAARKGEILRAVGLLEEARVMSTGPLVEGLEGPMLERERLYRQERFLADMEVRAELELELGRHRNAVPYLYYAVDKYQAAGTLPVAADARALPLGPRQRGADGVLRPARPCGPGARRGAGLDPAGTPRATAAPGPAADGDVGPAPGQRGDLQGSGDAFVPTPRLPLARRGPFG